MASTTAAWDLTGSRSVLPSGTASKSSTVGGGSTSQISETQQQISAVSKQNTPQFALDALEQLIASLSDRPQLSNEEAAAQFPLSERIFDRRAGWGYLLPNGSPYFGRDAQAVAKRWDEQQLAKREQAQQASGIIKGGTAATAEGSAARSQTLETLTRGLGEYSKEAAFADASTLAGRFQRELLETLMPNITKAIESSGTSGGAVGGLLAQDAAARTAEAQAALGLQTSVQYGQLSNQIAQILAQLSTALPPELQALLQSLGIAKGTVEQGVSTASSTSQKTVQTQEDKQATEQTQQQGNPLAALTSGLRIGPVASTPSVAGQTVPNVVGATSTTLDQTLQELIRRDTYGSGFIL